jgi:hypothetical protein
MKSVLLPFLFLSLTFSSFSQNEVAPKVFLDCGGGCDYGYTISQISFVNFMRDVQLADIYILMTRLPTGGAGSQYTLYIEGQNRFEGHRDTLVYFSEPGETFDTRRNRSLKYIKLSILPLILQTDIIEDISYSVESELTAQETIVQTNFDPWNSWTFSTSMDASISGEESFFNTRISNTLAARRVTVDGKFNFDIYFRYSERRFDLDENETIKTFSRLTDIDLDYVRSLDEHWSFGAFSTYINSTFSNFQMILGLRPGVEFNIYPYQEATTREFTFRYMLGPSFRSYVEKTIFGKDQEWLLEQIFSVKFESINKWGELEMDLNFSNFMHDLSLLRLNFDPSIEWNVTKGLFLRMYAGVSFIRNQLNIPEVNYSDDQILLRIRQLKTNYDYQAGMGVSYRFGSSFNNVVNTRF